MATVRTNHTAFAAAPTPGIKTYSFEDGKYEIDRDTKTGLIVTMRRHGEQWPEGRSSFAHVKLFHSMLNALDMMPLTVSPIGMVLYCPNCGKQHVDEPEQSDPSTRTAEKYGNWNNPPHRSHLCHGCGCIWRPADVPTNGVASIKTAGKADTWPVNSEEIAAQRAVKLSVMGEHAAFKCPACSSPYFGAIFEKDQHVGRYCKGWPSGVDRSYQPCKGKHEERFTNLSVPIEAQKAVK